MGVSRSPAELVGKLAKFADSQEIVAHEAVVTATKAVAGTITAELAKVTHGTGRLSGVGKKGARLGVITVLTANQGIVTARGPWQFIEADTKRHNIAPKKRRGKKALTIGSGLYASAKNTGGSKGKQPFAKGTIAGEPLAIAAFHAAEDTALREVFA